MDTTCFVSVHIVWAQEGDFTQTVENGTNVMIVCDIAVTLPMWKGPPIGSTGRLTQYNYQSSATFNPNLGREMLSRLSWAANNRDLSLSPVTRDDEGTYQCYHGGQSWTVHLVVRGTLTFYLIIKR